MTEDGSDVPANDPDLVINREFFPEGTDYRAFCEAIITSADVGLLVIDTEGNFLLLNPTLRSMMGLAFPDGHQGSAGQTGDVYAEDGVTEVPYDMLPSVRATRGEEFNDYMLWMGRQPESRRALSISARVMRAADGKSAGAVIVTRDVTEVCRAVRAREDFLAAVSHELRTPLTSLLGYLELAMDADEDGVANMKNYIGIAQRNGSRLLRMVDDLLGAATLEQGLTLARVETNLNTLIHRAVDAAQQSASVAGLRLSLTATVLPLIRLDEDRITQVLENLLTNAIKFTPYGGSVQVKTWAEEGAVVITVRDDGVGIDASDRLAVFERFFRSSNAHKQAIQGVGLGLHIVKVIVEAHGGTISAVPNPDGAGTEIVVRLGVA